MLFSISMRISAMSTESFVDYTKVDGLVYIFSVDNSIKYDGMSIYLNPSWFSQMENMIVLYIDLVS